MRVKLLLTILVIAVNLAQGTQVSFAQASGCDPSKQSCT